MRCPDHPDAVAPERTRRIRSLDGELVLYEWGDPAGKPCLLVHGFLDNGHGFDSLAPLLAERFRVVSFDARGHGDSSRADAYSWERDVEDLARVLQSLGQPAHLVGHSRGGGQATDCAALFPELVKQLVNIDGFGPPDEGFHPIGRSQEDDGSMGGLPGYLKRRRGAAEGNDWKHYPDFDALVDRRLSQNPRLTRDWLAYFVFHCARETPEGWLWKVDPYLTMNAGPWMPRWIAPGWAPLRAPMLAIPASEEDTWGPLPEATLEERLSFVKNVERAEVPGTGHFVHMEKPRETAGLLLDWLT